MSPLSPLDESRPALGFGIWSDSHLESLMADLESDLVERQESLRGDAPERLRQAICAFANDFPDHRRPGIAFVGADDRGSPTGIAVTDSLLTGLWKKSLARRRGAKRRRGGVRGGSSLPAKVGGTDRASDSGRHPVGKAPRIRPDDGVPHFFEDGSHAGRFIHRLLKQLADMGTDGNIVPPPSLAVGKRRLLGAEVAVVVVRPSASPPVRYRGRTWIRIGPRRAVASAEDERVLSEKRRHRDPHHDARPVAGATLAELRIGDFEHDYLPAAFDAETLARNDRTLEERLAATKMVVSPDDPAPTVTGILVLGQAPRSFLPGAYIQFLRTEGVEWGGPVRDETVCEGPLSKMIGRLDDKLLAHNRTAVHFLEGPVERRVSTHAAEALRQLTRNAVLHRSYEGTNAPVRVYWFDDRIEILSPGGPYGAVTAENFGDPGVADYRNPNLAEAMRVLGLVQRYGYGIPAARRALGENDQPEPEFEVTPSLVRCVVRPRPS